MSVNEGEKYWKDRCLAVEQRMDQLEKEIFRLRGFKPLTKEFIEEHNRRIREEVKDVIQESQMELEQ